MSTDLWQCTIMWECTFNFLCWLEFVCLIVGVLRPDNIDGQYQDYYRLVCDSAHSWRIYSAASLEHHVDNIITWYPTQSYYPDVVLISHCLILVMLSSRLSSDSYTFSMSLVSLGWDSNSQPSARGACALSIPPPRLVCWKAAFPQTHIFVFEDNLCLSLIGT